MRDSLVLEPLTLNEGTIMRNLYISIDPVMKVWLSGARTYAIKKKYHHFRYLPPLRKGDVMHAFGLAQSPDGKIHFGTVGARTHFLLEEME